MADVVAFVGLAELWVGHAGKIQLNFKIIVMNIIFLHLTLYVGHQPLFFSSFSVKSLVTGNRPGAVFGSTENQIAEFKLLCYLRLQFFCRVTLLLN